MPREPSFESDCVPEERPLRWPEPQNRRPPGVSPVKHSKWYQPDEPDNENIHPMAVLGHLLGVLFVIWGLLALIG